MNPAAKNKPQRLGCFLHHPQSERGAQTVPDEYGGCRKHGGHDTIVSVEPHLQRLAFRSGKPGKQYLDTVCDQFSAEPRKPVRIGSSMRAVQHNDSQPGPPSIHHRSFPKLIVPNHLRFRIVATITSSREGAPNTLYSLGLQTTPTAVVLAEEASFGTNDGGARVWCSAFHVHAYAFGGRRSSASTSLTAIR